MGVEILCTVAFFFNVSVLLFFTWDEYTKTKD